ncbi:uncharacterized protein CC84DRAFT_1010104 [Paraphaeosphaeria sporulosa]|uniref:Cora-domain-containing protein n=1 Tax=Paraphaeosphaeria sporulosa TaxID=1460663 RepID=A0A177C6N5_9PLEO|nr:uncharacterized protein CC84DRAFT_1010104 [Paraphaeosphaeria sporulosa]OAG02360.1 hypothetical protein CC84DRAFT_1010104 [Paraphaeosphaeria sporulosa]
MATNEVERLREQLESLQRSHDILVKSLAIVPGGPFVPPETPTFQRQATRPSLAFADASTLSDTDSEEDESYFVQEELPSKSFDHEHLRAHLQNHNWKEHGREILAPLIKDPGKLSKQPHLFHLGPGTPDDRSHYSHFQVYDVGPDGATELIETSGSHSTNTMSRATEIWHSIRNIGNSTDKPTVGRITIAREPAPILFGALHLTLNDTFDMDELFKHLVQTEASSAHMHRAFKEDQKHQKTFFFTFEYYTILGEDCKPMDWQRADKAYDPKGSHLPLSRCGAVVALALYDPKPRRIRNRGRRAKTQYGWVQDIWSPWQVLQLECFPDWRATPDTFESGNRFLNGPEAFLHALLTEYRDARKRYEEIYTRITELITPPLGFLFDAELRDQRLFEDRKFTWTRRYFYAHQTLGNVNDSIKSMIDAFEDTFTDEVWEGKSKTLWPLYEESPRNDHWKRRLRTLRLAFEREMKELRTLQRENNERRQEVKSLQDHLFSGTSIQESRKSVELSDITVQQGRNIKLLTIVNLFFMPLTFVTSVYGMTNMPGDPSPYWPFAITLAAVCVPFFSLIGFLSTDFGYRIWVRKTKSLYRWLRPKAAGPPQEDDEAFEPRPVDRTLSTEEGMRLRMGAGPGGKGNRERRPTVDSGKGRESLSHPNIRRMVEAMGEGRQSGLVRMGNVTREKEGGGDAVVDMKGG